MPTDKPRFTITLEQDLVTKIDNYKYSHRMKNQNQAVISLIEKGFDSLAADRETKNSPAPEGAEERISMEQSDRLFDALVQAGIIPDSISFTEDDRAFLQHIIGLLDVWSSRERK